ncbi:right-handed parallel beta-helix repeat-containing protein [Tropicibacter oceani]|uniref:Serine protease n=1 Tax=Tropicibacter oceani TaxID=3058420 RepID=A0ABY8QFA2_9RHOB|nr:right-handed parallel beta-helix repeat-containing protein [Tropicibacter oceani]WGW02673.1 right-handed parallel beta-helix repeat-containing protein [Tropicibacter oceani]
MRRAIFVVSLVVTCLTGPAAQAQAPAQFDPDDFGKIVIQPRQSAGGGGGSGFVLEQAFGDYQNEPIIEYGENSPAVRLGRPIGRLDTLYANGQTGFCTAFIVDDKHIVTNHHCIPGMDGDPSGADSGIQAAQFVAGYIQPGRSAGVDKYSVSPQIVETNRGLDYTVLRVFGNPSEKYGIMELAAADPEDAEFLWIIGHPQGQSQHISREGCAAASPAISEEGKLIHSCDTLQGNSGSPVIRISDKRVIGLHHAGDNRTGFNMAIPMTRILAQSKVLHSALPVAGAVVAAAPAPAPQLKAPETAAPRLAALPETSACDALWSEAKQLGCGGYEAYLSQCASHTFSVMAKVMAKRECAAAAAPLVDPATLAQPIPVPGTPGAIRVAQDGSGDFTDLAQAVAGAKPGARIEVFPGTYTTGLDISQPVEIVGVGNRADIRLEVANDNIISWQADKGLIKGLTLRQTGGDYFGIDVLAGSVVIEDNDISSQGLSGVVLRSNVGAVVRRNEIHGGKEGGIFVFDNGKGEILENVLYGNTYAGIELRDGGEALIKDNTIRDGQGQGIFVNTGGKGQIEDNVIHGNRLVGISLDGSKNPVIKGNVIRDGLEGGILAAGHALARIEGNTLYGNAYSAIEIRTEADPWIKGNTIRDGKQSGIFVLDNGRGMIENNDIYRNAFSGIAVQAKGAPIVRGNRITRNGQFGVEILEGGGGGYENNDLTGNDRAAFFIDKAAGTLSRRGNKE